MNLRPGQKIRVGYFNRTYVADRLLLNLPFRNVALERRRDLFNVVTFAQRKLFRPPAARDVLNCLHHDRPFANTHLIHLINCISITSTPWVVSYEHYLPRWDWDSQRGWKYLASPACKKIIAMSRWAQKFQESLLGKHAEFSDAIRPKFCMVTPSQEMLVERYDDKVLDPERITFTLVGTDFFRKGGREILEAFVQLVEEKLPVHLTIVSTLDYGDYASRATEEEHTRARTLIARMGEHVTHHESLDNAHVLELFRRSHVGLLPTYHDTYGFSALEAQGAGCPVITTDSNALPEFNDDKVGWLISVPKDEHGVVRYVTPADREQLSQCIREGLLRIVRQICSDPSVIRAKGERVLNQIRQDFSPDDRVRQMEEIYREVLASG